MRAPAAAERFETVIIGGGQAGLAAGYHLARRGLPFVILEAADRVGDVWRNRWDSLRLFTPARYDGLPGLPFPAPPHSFPSKDDMGDFLEHYAATFRLPVRTGVRVDGLSRANGHYLLTARDRRMEADNVVVAMANYQDPWTPGYAAELDPGIVQLHSGRYRNPGQLRPGRVLIVGAGNSGAEIARELAPHHDVWLSGRDTGEIPFRIASVHGRVLIRLVLRVLFHRILTVDTPLGRAVRPKVVGRGGPLIRVKRRDLAHAGVALVPRTVGVRAGRPVLEDGRVLETENVVWCTGFRTGFESWIHLPIHGDHEPEHDRGVVPAHPGLYFLGLHFLRALSSAMIQGVGRDADRIARSIADRTASPRTRRGPAAAPQRAGARDVATSSS